MGRKYQYGCLMANFDIPEWGNLQQGFITENDMYQEEGFGFESNPHVTVLFGLSEEVTVENLKPFLMPLDEISVLFDKIDAFHLDEYDVLKFNAQSRELAHLHEQICSKFPNHKEYPYVPHMTIGYLMKETAKKYVKALDTSFELVPSHYSYSYSNGDVEQFTI